MKTYFCKNEEIKELGYTKQEWETKERERAISIIKHIADNFNVITVDAYILKEEDYKYEMDRYQQQYDDFTEYEVSDLIKQFENGNYSGLLEYELCDKYEYWRYDTTGDLDIDEIFPNDPPIEDIVNSNAQVVSKDIVLAVTIVK